MPNAALSRLTVSPELALEFLATFSRFEYALKTNILFRLNNNGEAKANWISFIGSISFEFNPISTDNLQKAFDYLLEYPLKRLEVSGDSLELNIYTFSTNNSPLDKVVLKIKQIRNNLFHGGKYFQSSAEPNSYSDLLKHSITVLLAIKNLNDQVRNAYDS